MGENTLDSKCDTCSMFISTVNNKILHSAKYTNHQLILAYKCILSSNADGTRNEREEKLFVNVHLNEIIGIAANKIITNIPIKYKLKSVIFHIGDIVEAGRYVTVARDKNDYLFNFDDAHVHRVQTAHGK